MNAQLSPKRVAFSLAAVSGIISAACALLIALAPSFTMNFFGSIFHGIDMNKIAKSMTFSSAILGIIVAAILAFIIGWLFAKLYNAIKR